MSGQHNVNLDELRTELLELGTATLYEAAGFECVLPSSLHPAWPGAVLVARALPVSTVAGDNLALHLAVEQAQSGEALVVNAQDSAYGCWGEVLTVFAQTRGVAGLVILGGVRDVIRLGARGFPVFSTRLALHGTAKGDAGTIGQPVRFDRVTVWRGDIIVADADGIVSIPAAEFAGVLDRARDRAQKEIEFMERLARGESSVDLYGFARP
ncbi:RraA family protein [Microbacterium halotolerans]|uniref:RraA family protein n=1 Tax=Microbacterium halotolerans TaxID=246613 RepID=UPI001F08AD56|nr:hypothetical protein [Microbacterium halotolerans]